MASSKKQIYPKIKAIKKNKCSIVGILTVHKDKDVLTIKMNTKESKLFS